jgi:hypothetical protein
MVQPGGDALLARWEKGRRKTSEVFRTLALEQWQQPIYPEPAWSARNILAHYLSAEVQLLALAQNVTSGGTGAPEGFDINAFNAAEQDRLSGQSPQELLDALDRARQQTIAWVATLQESQLDNMGRHPALGQISVETMILAIYGHQLMHMRDLNQKLGDQTPSP